MKKQYIQPESHVAVVRLFGAILNTETGFGTVSQGAYELSREHDNDRFEDSDESWELE